MLVTGTELDNLLDLGQERSFLKIKQKVSTPRLRVRTDDAIAQHCTRGCADSNSFVDSTHNSSRIRLVVIT